jgi:hypothetical protein
MNDQLNRYLNRNSLFAQEIGQKFPQVWDVVGEVIQRTNTLMHEVRTIARNVGSKTACQLNHKGQDAFFL